MRGTFNQEPTIRGAPLSSYIRYSAQYAGYEVHNPFSNRTEVFPDRIEAERYLCRELCENELYPGKITYVHSSGYERTSPNPEPIKEPKEEPNLLLLLT